MKLIKTYIIKIIYEYGNRFGIGLPSLQLVKRGGTGIFLVQGVRPGSWGTEVHKYLVQLVQSQRPHAVSTGCWLDDNLV